MVILYYLLPHICYKLAILSIFEVNVIFLYMPNNTKDKKEYQKTLSLLNIGTELTIPIVVFALIGYWVDTEYKSQPTLMIIGLFVGLLVGVYNFWKIIRKLNQNDK